MDANLEFLVGDARVYQNPGRFDAAICLYTSFGYFETEDEDLQLLKNVCVSLKDSGTFVLDMNGKEVLQRTFTDRSSEDLEDGSTFSEERTIGPEWDWMENRWVVTRGASRGKRLGACACILARSFDRFFCWRGSNPSNSMVIGPELLMTIKPGG